MKLKIFKYPDPVLLKPGEPVTEFDAALQKTADDMFETMYGEQGVGLAAPQVGVSKRLIVIDLSMGKRPEEKIVLVNPEIIESAGKQYSEEGCLSFPDIREKVSRAFKVTVRAQDTKGKWFEKEGEELLARCFLHEIDHIEGIVFLERMTPLKRSMCQRQIRKMQRDGTW
jgi:peptide deformylase